MAPGAASWAFDRSNTLDVWLARSGTTLTAYLGDAGKVPFFMTSWTVLDTAQKIALIGELAAGAGCTDKMWLLAFARFAALPWV